MSDFPAWRYHKPIISTMSKESLRLSHVARASAAAPASTAWGTTNLAIYVPFSVAAPYLVRKCWWLNGTTANGNVDCGVYTWGGARLLSAGATAQAGTSVVQSAAPSGGSMLLMPGSYFMALALSSATGTIFARTLGSARAGAILGMAEQTTAEPLPATATFATFSTQQMLPIFGLLDGATI